jgi:hypothetical protein
MAFFKKLLSIHLGHQRVKCCVFQCDWFDPIHGTRVDDFGMVEVKHESCYTGINLLLAHQAQQVYSLSYPHVSIKNWWVVYKINPEIHARRYDEYIEKMRRRMSIKKKSKYTKVSWYLTGQDSQN